DQPPAYDFVAAQSSNDASMCAHDTSPKKQAQQDSLSPAHVKGVHPRPVPAMHETTVYHYNNPLTGDHLASLLPPDHPEMICLQRGGHDTQTKFGLIGILAAIFWFPLGVGLCLLDRRVVCRRCGMLVEDGICG
ncbi:hypothetical protein SCLCIDRAFT_102780, partial [Scleroderma citrinum Foug A]